MFTVLKIQLKLILEKVMALFAQPQAGKVAPIDEKVKNVMEAPYKIEPLVEIETKLTIQKAKKPAAKKPAAKKPAVKKVTAKKPAAKKTTPTKQ